MTARALSESEIAGAFVVRDAQWRQKIFVGGLLLLFIHPIGWPAALGYRKALISNLSSGRVPLLPEWRGQIFHHFTEGLKAMGVIFGYLFPLYLILLTLLFVNGVEPSFYWIYAVLFFVAGMILSTLSFPIILAYWTFFADDFRVPLAVSSVLFAAFVLLIFFIPSGFLQVSRSGKYRSAFDVPAAFWTLKANFRSYVIAWYRSSLMSLAGHCALPFAPWGVIWCYAGIIYEFNAILHRNHRSDVPESWFEKLRNHERVFVEPYGAPGLLRCLNPADQKPCLMLKLGTVFVPLPSMLVRWILRSRG